MLSHEGGISGVDARPKRDVAEIYVYLHHQAYLATGVCQDFCNLLQAAPGLLFYIAPLYLTRHINRQLAGNEDKSSAHHSR
jgi:hypothetical protein